MQVTPIAQAKHLILQTRQRVDQAVKLLGTRGTTAATDAAVRTAAARLSEAVALCGELIDGVRGGALPVEPQALAFAITAAAHAQRALEALETPDDAGSISASSAAEQAKLSVERGLRPLFDALGMPQPIR